MDNDTLVDYTDDFETLRESISSNWSIFTSIDFEVSFCEVISITKTFKNFSSWYKMKTISNFEGDVYLNLPFALGGWWFVRVTLVVAFGFLSHYFGRWQGPVIRHFAQKGMQLQWC